MPRVFVLQALGWSPRDAVGFVVAAVATVMVLANVLFMQSGPHPAPMFRSALAAPVALTTAGGSAAQPADAAPARTPIAPGPALASAPPPSQRPVAEIVADIQRELVRRGFYDGVVDGRYGPRT